MQMWCYFMRPEQIQMLISTGSPKNKQQRERLSDLIFAFSQGESQVVVREDMSNYMDAVGKLAISQQGSVEHSWALSSFRTPVPPNRPCWKSSASPWLLLGIMPFASHHLKVAKSCSYLSFPYRGDMLVCSRLNYLTTFLLVAEYRMFQLGPAI